MENQNASSLKSQFLIAMPGLMDPNFFQTVTCICEHSEQGAMGIVINRVHPSLLATEIFDELKIPCIPGAKKIPVNIGGPVHIDEIFVLHGPPFGWNGCFEISESLALSNSRDILEAISQGEGPDSVLIALGCAGWGPGQLEMELRQNAWLNVPLHNEIIFEVSVEARWEQAVRKMGIDPSLLSSTAGNA